MKVEQAIDWILNEVGSTYKEAEYTTDDGSVTFTVKYGTNEYGHGVIFLTGKDRAIAEEHSGIAASFTISINQEVPYLKKCEVVKRPNSPPIKLFRFNTALREAYTNHLVVLIGRTIQEYVTENQRDAKVYENTIEELLIERGEYAYPEEEDD